jgi:predicted Zn finger-like uncharacterized protein
MMVRSREVIIPMPLDIRCPNCQTEYLLPETLLGPGGARVRCPSCRHSFAVTREGAVAPHDGGRAPALGAAAPGPSAPEAEHGERREDRIARMVLDEVLAHAGATLHDAQARGRAFAEHGPELMAAWDEYRRRAGKDADPVPFRDALRERWGIDLPGTD